MTPRVSSQTAADRELAAALAVLAEVVAPEERRWFSYCCCKRAIDVMAGLLGVALLLCLFPVIASAIKLDSPGPVLFRHRRPGLHKRRFWLYKFRSMHMDAESRLPDLLAERQDGKPILIDIPDDPRVTRVGRWLRKTSLDELPQFVSILLGEMSLVGPRPFSRALQSDHPLLEERFVVKPGLTGLWQVSGRKNTTFDEALAMDIEYIRRWSLWFDLRIVLCTFLTVFGARGAR